ncbi:hypothetical protein RND71_030583 [Anisodus tanguticus]|uniref:Uncharacterized protein n=1 Tax=Anisodus tanguticus TaxID=243964 RepID=A0AAE1RGQ2_9SOLA|nr:hypothetical protein RND71_030583 [Anisodus tanguticus]
MSDSLVCASRRVEWGATCQRLERADAEARQRGALPTTIGETTFYEPIKSPGFGPPPPPPPKSTLPRYYESLVSTTTCRDVRRCGLAFRLATSSRRTGGQYWPRDSTASHSMGAVCWGDAMHDVRQTCPRPKGFGRNLHSHQVSRFATFFSDARAEVSVAESRFSFKRSTGPLARTADEA